MMKKRKLGLLLLCMFFCLIGISSAVYADTDAPTRTEVMDLTAMPATDQLETEGWKWEPGSEKNTLTLQNFRFESGVDKPFITLPEGVTEIVLKGENIIFRNALTNNASILSPGDILIKGEGSLEFKQKYFKDAGGKKYPTGVQCKNFNLVSGILKANTGAVTTTENLKISGGTLTLSNSDTEYGSIVSFLECAGNLIMTGGSVDITDNFERGESNFLCYTPIVSYNDIVIQNATLTCSGKFGYGIYVMNDFIVKDGSEIVLNIDVPESDDIPVLYSPQGSVLLQGGSTSITSNNVGIFTPTTCEITGNANLTCKALVPLYTSDLLINTTGKVDILGTDCAIRSDNLGGVLKIEGMGPDSYVRMEGTSQTDRLKYPETATCICADASYDEIDRLLNMVPEDLSEYTKESADAVLAAVDAVERGKCILDRRMVDSYATDLSEALDNLTLIVTDADYSKVEEAIRYAKSLNRYRYSNFYVVDRAIRNVDWDKTNAEQEEVDQYARDIYDAIDQLKIRTDYPVKPVTPVTPSTPTTPETPENPSDVHPTATVTTPEQDVAVRVTKAPEGLLKDVKAQVKDSKVIDGSDCALTIEAVENGQKKNSFRQPLTVQIKVPVGALSDVEDRSDLTLARVDKDMRGNVTLEYMGGTYNPTTGIFTAKVDEAGTYILVAKENLTKIVLTVGDTDTLLNDRHKAIDVAPIILNGRTMVPLRYIGEALGCKVDWDDMARTVTVTDGGKNFTMTIDQEIPGYGQAPVIRNDRTLVPIRYISESLGANVIYDPAEEEVIIVK